MDLNNYLNILLKGLIEDPKNLKNHLIRNQKILERDDFVTSSEFYTKILDVIINLKEKCKKRYLENKEELIQVLSLKKLKGLDTKETENQIQSNTIEMFPINLMHLTNGIYEGFLKYSNLEYVDAIILGILKNEVKLEPNEPQKEDTNKPDEVKKTLNDYFINIKDDEKDSFFNELKTTFPTEKGKSIRAIIDTLKNQQLLSIGTREYSKFLIELKKMFGRDIGKYQGIQNLREIDKETKETVEIKLNPLINKYRTK